MFNKYLLTKYISNINNYALLLITSVEIFLQRGFESLHFVLKGGEGLFTLIKMKPR